MAVDVSKRLGIYMRKRRKRAGWESLQELAEEMERIRKQKEEMERIRKLKDESQPDKGWSEVSVSKSTLEKYENGSRWPTPKVSALWFEAVGVNFWYRDQIRKLMNPELWQLDWGELPATPSEDNLKVLHSMGIAAAYLSDPMWKLLAANKQFLDMFPGLEVGMNVAEWMLSSNWARLNIYNWRLRTHVLVSAIANIGQDIVPDEEIEDFKNRCGGYPEFNTFWTTDPPEDQIMDTSMILRLPDGTLQRYISGTTHGYHPPVLYSGYSLTLDPDFVFD
ncbi:helix-turn-helix domain-containing protein [Nocardia sp. CA-119907]|uniref:helix-turn-helix domain-containing protein n=1 Tax=Nocardia sp. CA-119907 TaxID=3239973 RepID=UPI003D9634F7